MGPDLGWVRGSLGHLQCTDTADTALQAPPARGAPASGFWGSMRPLGFQMSVSLLVPRAYRKVESRGDRAMQHVSV